MNRLLVSLAVLTLLAACGIDGPPRRPVDDPPPGLSLSGEVEIGLKHEL